jgi:predicted RNase H-like nuclease (RuvC/YqgF family)
MENKYLTHSSSFNISGGDKTNKDLNVPNDLRHESETDDLQSTCRALETQLKQENETLRAENIEWKKKMESLEASRGFGAQSDDETRRMKSEIENLKTELEGMRSRVVFNTMMEKVSQTEGDGDAGMAKKLETLEEDYVRK